MDVANLGLASRLAERGIVELVTHRVDEELRSNANVQTHLVSRPFGIQLLGETQLKRAASQCQSSYPSGDVTAVVNGGNCFWPGSINWVHYVHAAYEPYVHGNWIRRWKAAFHRRRSIAWEKRALQMARLVICNSDLTRNHVIELIGISPERVKTVYYGIDAERFQPPSIKSKLELRKKLGWDDEALRVMFVGALGDRRKGFDTVASAWERLCSDPTWKAQLVVVGVGAELKVWQERLQRGPTAGRVEFLGFRKDVADLMRAADALVAPTRYEAYGLGVHEAICCGLATFVSQQSGVGERYPLELKDFLIADPNDGESLANKLKAWSRNPEALRNDLERFSQLLRSRTWSDMADEIIEISGKSS
jgi:glycosyltransferase involved in cell wall biosynthesis